MKATYRALRVLAAAALLTAGCAATDPGVADARPSPSPGAAADGDWFVVHRVTWASHQIDPRSIARSQ